MTSRRYSPSLRGRFGDHFAGTGNSQRVLREIRQIERLQQTPAIHVGIRAHAAISIRRERRDFRDELPFLIE